MLCGLYNGSISLSNPQSFNRYAYVQGDPVNFVDPTGTMCQLVDSLTGPGEHAPTYYLWACTRPDNFSGFTGGGGGGGGDKGDRPPTNPEGKGNPNCIMNAVKGATGLTRPFGNVGPTGSIGHTGPHVLGPTGSPVTTLPALTGRVIGNPHQQAVSGADSKLYAVDVLLDGGNVGIYVDLVTVNVHADQYLKLGTQVGTIGSGTGEAAGLHFALLRGGRAEDAYFRGLTSRAARGDYTASHDIKVGMFINPLGPQSPVNCPGVPVDNGTVNPYP